jgi:alkylation response protein AidB-like acyl-CoA dehydrogenase
VNDTGYSLHADIILKQIEAVPGYRSLASHLEGTVDLSPEALGMIIQAAAQFSEEVLCPINHLGDRQGCRLEGGRVKTPDGYPEAWQKFVENGWHNVDLPANEGGQGLPFFVNVACRELFDRACMAFGMFGMASRAAISVLKSFAEPGLAQEWIEQFATGRWAASIAISEADAGSDVGRIRTRAAPAEDGTWRITGEKMWTSFGDNDAVERIGHFLLARTPEAPPGTAGLSLFLVPNLLRGDAAWDSNGVVIRRLEEKLGLHGSPTCVTGFENARGWLIGKTGRGLPQLFAMLQNMRVLVAVQGTGMAQGAAQVACDYAASRRQGGPPTQPPVPIASHADIQRLLLNMVSRVEVLRGLILELAIRLDSLPFESDPSSRQASLDLTQWLQPILKASCAEAGFEVSNDAIQILGGAGYTREWPVEQWLRDARMMSIAEGSSGIQALDLLHRRVWRDDLSGLRSFLAIARREIAGADTSLSTPAVVALDQLERCASRLSALKQTPREAEAGATAFLRLGMLAATGWIAVRLAQLEAAADPLKQRLVAAGRYWLSDLESRAAYEASQAMAGAERLKLFEKL